MKHYRLVNPDGTTKEFTTEDISVSLAQMFLDKTITNAEKCVIQEKDGEGWVDRITFGKHQDNEPEDDGKPWTLDDILAREG